MPVRSAFHFAIVILGLLLAAGAAPVCADDVVWQPYRPGTDLPPPYIEPRVIDGNVYLDSDPTCEGPMFPGQTMIGPPVAMSQPAYWEWQLLPDGLIYHNYLASPYEPRLSGVFFQEKNAGWLLDATLGGRVGLLRYGSTDGNLPDGWQLDVEGAAFPRLNLDNNWDLVSADFKAGVPLTYGVGPFRLEVGYYHLSSHLGDEQLLNVPGATRINYVRDSVILGLSYYLLPALRLYGEADWAFHNDGGSEPWHFQFGAELSPVQEGCLGAPFLAVNAQLMQEVDYSGNLVAQAGWQWRGRSGHRLRIGAHYLNGKSNQYQFFQQFEEQIGGGVWYDY